MSPVLPAHAGYFFGRSVVELAERLRDGSLTSVELTQAALDSIERLNPTLNAFVQVDAPVALAQARKADELLAQGQDLGPLHGNADEWADQEALDRLGVDSGVIQIMLIETSTQYLIDTARIRSRGGLLTFHDNKPEDLLGPPLRQYARSLLGMSDQ